MTFRPAFYLKIGFQKAFKPIAKILNYGPNVDVFGTDILLQNFFGTLLKIGFKPSHIVDIGAHKGDWTRNAFNFFPDSNFTLFEPQMNLAVMMSDLLKNDKIKLNPFGVGKKQGNFKFTIASREDSCSFAYSESQAKSMGLKQVEIEVVTLNDFLPTTGLPIPDIIKIDAEGLDLEVLEGSSNFFGKTEIFMVEVAVACNSLNNTFLAVINFMDKNGYKLFDVTDINRPFEIKILWLMELVFIRKNGIIDSKKFD